MLEILMLEITQMNYLYWLHCHWSHVELLTLSFVNNYDTTETLC